MNRYLSLIAIGLLLISCSKEDKVEGKLETRTNSGQVFYASMEGTSKPETKVYADENMQVLWNEDDRISVFNKTTYNYQYQFTGEDGDNYGSFEEIPVTGLISGNNLANIYAVYPYAKSNKVNNAGTTITMTLPAEQTYKEHSFGIGANSMIAVTENNFLAFKNVGGYLSLRLYGNNVSIASISIKGNNNEKIAGKASIAVSTSTVPVTTMDNSATDEITLVCNPPVQIGSTAENYTDFWFVIPPVTFSNGFTITVTDALGGTFIKSTTRSFTVTRNQMDWMNPLQVEVNKQKRLTIEMLEDGDILTEVDVYYDLNTNHSLGIYYDLNPDQDGVNQNRQINNGIYGLHAGDIVQFYVNEDASAAWNCSITSTARHNISGNPMSLYYVNFDNVTDCAFSGQFSNLFRGDTGLINAEDVVMPSGIFVGGFGSTNDMFRGCSNLLYGPSTLPVLHLSSALESVDYDLYGMSFMFEGCTSLIRAFDKIECNENLGPATFESMFRNCTSLTTAPVLKINRCNPLQFKDLFYNCSSLANITFLGVYDDTFNNCFETWVYGVAPSGTFTKITNDEWPIGDNGIPNGWNIVGQNPSSAYIQLSPNKGTATYEEGQTITFQINCNEDWTITLPNYLPSWLTSVTPLSGTGNATITITTGLNNSNYDDQAILTVKSSSYTKHFTITKQAKPLIQFEDANFKAYCVSSFDTNNDGEISFDEALLVTAINVLTDKNHHNITSLNGIQFFKNLTSLSCNGYGYSGDNRGQLSSLDVSQNTALTSLNCENNQLSSLYVSNNTALTSLTCNNNQLTSLYIFNNTALRTLDCSSNQLTSLDIRNNTALTSLDCSSNQLTSLYVSNNTSLIYLNCAANPFNTLDVSHNTALTYLDCHDNQLTAINLSNNTALTYLDCRGNNLSTLDVSQNTALKDLKCYWNQLTTLDLSQNSALENLICNGNLITSLDLRNNIKLSELDAWPQQGTLLTVYIKRGLSINYSANPSDYGTTIIEVD